MSLTAEIASVRGGYSMADLDRLAKAAARRWGGMYASDYLDRYEAAWAEIATRLYEAAEPPAERDLLLAGMDGVQHFLGERNHSQGRSGRHGYEFGSAPRFATYWNEAQVTPSHEPRIVENVALRQALAVLTGDQYDALVAVATSGSLSAAAELLGWSRSTLLSRFYAARKAVQAVWFEAESAPRPVGSRARASEDACGSGHATAEHGKVGPSGHRYCGECQRLARKRRRARGLAA